MANWYLLRGGTANGPYPEEQVREWIRAGQIAPDEKLNREGDANWLSLDMIPEFAADRPAPGSVPFVPASGTGFGGGTGAAGQPRDKMVAGILAILLGVFGVHHFYLGNMKMAWIYLGVSIVSCGLLSPFTAIAGIVDGVMYLTKPDDVFQRNYMNWFCQGL